MCRSTGIVATRRCSKAARRLPDHARQRRPARTVLHDVGVCFDCLVEVDGVPNVQACIEARVCDGMRVRAMSGKARPA